MESKTLNYKRVAHQLMSGIAFHPKAEAFVQGQFTGKVERELAIYLQFCFPKNPPTKKECRSLILLADKIAFSDISYEPNQRAEPRFINLKIDQLKALETQVLNLWLEVGGKWFEGVSSKDESKKFGHPLRTAMGEIRSAREALEDWHAASRINNRRKNKRGYLQLSTILEFFVQVYETGLRHNSINEAPSLARVESEFENLFSATPGLGPLQEYVLFLVGLVASGLMKPTNLKTLYKKIRSTPECCKPTGAWTRLIKTQHSKNRSRAASRGRKAPPALIPG